MNRRQLLSSLAALGLVAAAEPVVEPVRRYFALDRTMVHPEVVEYWDRPWTMIAAQDYIETARYDASMASFAKTPEWSVIVQGPEHHGVYGWRAAAWRYRPDRPPIQVKGYPPVPCREEVVTPMVYEPMVPASGYSARDEAIRILFREMSKSDPILL